MVVLVPAYRPCGSALKYGVQSGLNHPDLFTRGRRNDVKRLSAEESDGPKATFFQGVGSI